MNNPVTSREELLAAARDIVFSQGIDKLNMRNLAARCGIALGSVYGYFSSKTDLVFAVVEDFWLSVFSPEKYAGSSKDDFIGFFEDVFSRMSDTFSNFEFAFMPSLSASENADKMRGKEIERKYFARIRDVFLNVLRNDADVRSDVWSERFTEEQFVSFVIANMTRLLVQRERDCSYLTEVIRRLIYRQP